MTGLESVARYLGARVIGRLRQAGKRLSDETGEVIHAGPDRLRGTFAAELGADLALERLEARNSRDPASSGRPSRRSRETVENPAEAAARPGTVVELLLAGFEEARTVARSPADIGLQEAEGVPAGQFSTQAIVS